MRASKRRPVIKRQPRRPLPTLELLEDRLCLTVPSFYTIDSIALTGSTTSAGDAITNLSSTVSLNSSGRVAFIGTLTGALGTGTAVVTGDGGGTAPIKTSFAVLSSTRDFAFPQINDSGLVVARDRLSGSPAQFLVRTWDSNAPGTFHTVAFFPNGNPVTLPNISNDDSVSYVEIDTTSSTLTTSIELSQGGLTTTVATLPGNVTLRPMVANGGLVVARAGNNPTDPINLYGPDGGLVIASAPQFSALGRSSGISDDGQIVVFYGYLSHAGAGQLTALQGATITEGPGVFASVAQGTGRVIVRVAGSINSGFTDAGERRLRTGEDVGPDFDYDGNADWAIGSFFDDDRVGVEKDPSGEFATVVYTATDTLFGNRKAIFESRLNLFDSAVGVEGYALVAEVGKPVGPIPFAADLSLYDPVNKFGQIAFWATDGTTQAIVRADPFTPTHPSYSDLVNGRDRFQPDSPAVQYVVQGVPDPDGRGASPQITQVVVHATDGFERNDIKLLTASSAKGIHYLVSQEGRITQVLPEAQKASHAPPSNTNSIGIELVDHGELSGNHETEPNWATQAQLKSAALLVRDIADRNGIPLTHLAIDPADLFPATNGNRAKTTDFVVPAIVPGPHESLGNYVEDVRPPTYLSNWRQDGYGPLDPANAGIISHAQVLKRTSGKDDPRIFDWNDFMSRVSGGLTLQLSSGANIWLTDPLGRTLGLNPITGERSAEIGTFRIQEAREAVDRVIYQLIIPEIIRFGIYRLQIWRPLSGFSATAFSAATSVPDSDGSLQIWTSDAGADLRKIVAPGDTPPGTMTTYEFAYFGSGADTSSLSGDADLLPTALDDFALTDQDVPISVDLAQNDTDPENALVPGSVSIVVNPLHGTVNVDPSNGVAIYTPQPGYFGDDLFQYTIQDAAGGTSNSALVSLSIAANTIPPQAQDDETATSAGVPVTLNVIANDSDLDGSIDPTTVEIPEFGDPSHGLAEVDPATGAITYYPDPGFVGTDTIGYVVRDNTGAVSNQATVLVTVNESTNARPVAGNDTASTNRNTPAVINVLANDTDPDGTIDPTTVAIAGGAAHGTTSVDLTTGVITYTPALNYTGPDSFMYSVNDNSGAVSNVATVSIVVNAPPVAGDDTATTNKNMAVTIDVLSNDSDPDGTVDPTTVAIVGAAGHGTTTVNPTTGAITYTPAANYTGPDSFTYRIKDNLGADSNVATVSITVNAPPVAVNDTASTNENTAALISVLTNDSDLDGVVDPATVAILAAALHGTTSVNPTTGAITYTPAPNYTGPDSFTYKVKDNLGADSNVATVSITVNGSSSFSTKVQTDLSHAKEGGSTLPIMMQVDDASGNNVSSPSLPVTVLGIGTSAAQNPSTLMEATSNGNTNPGGQFRSVGNSYIFNLKLVDASGKALKPGTYYLYFTIDSDPTLHTLAFNVK